MRILYLHVAATIVLLSACSSTGSLAVQNLDPVTLATITRAAKPLVFYRDQSGRAAFSRDYVDIGPIEVNNMGERHFYLWLGIWGTSGDRSETLDDFESIVIFADGEPMTLEAKGWTTGSIGASEPVYVKPVASATDAFYSVTIDQIRVLAEATDIELRAGALRPLHYTPWDTSASRMASMLAFLHRTY